MSHFSLMYDIKDALERVVDLDDLIAALFADHPDLLSVKYTVTNEYDDNNYSDHSRLCEVNGRAVDYDGEYEEDEDEEDSEEPKASQESIDAAMNLSDAVQSKFGLGDHGFSRSNYPIEEVRDRLKNTSPDFICATSMMQNKKIPLETLVEAEGNWWRHHAEMHGKYTPEEEFALFAREGWMGLASEYARKFGPLSEKTLNFFILSARADSDEDNDHENLQEYLEWLKEKVA